MYRQMKHAHGQEGPSAFAGALAQSGTFIHGLSLAITIILLAASGIFAYSINEPPFQRVASVLVLGIGPAFLVYATGFITARMLRTASKLYDPVAYRVWQVAAWLGDISAHAVQAVLAFAQTTVPRWTATLRAGARGVFDCTAQFVGRAARISSWAAGIFASVAKSAWRFAAITLPNWIVVLRAHTQRAFNQVAKAGECVRKVTVIFARAVIVGSTWPIRTLAIMLIKFQGRQRVISGNPAYHFGRPF